MHKKLWLKLFLIALFLFVVAFGANGASVDELKAQIESRNAEIKKLDAEIEKYRLAVSQTKGEANSLKKEIERLEGERKKLQNDIAVTQNKIAIADLNINRLNQGIKTAAEKIEINQTGLEETLRHFNDLEQTNLAEILVSEENLSDLLTSLDRYQSLNRQAEDQINILRTSKEELESNKKEKETEKGQLTVLKSQLTDQKKITDENKQTKDNLLEVTKNKETNYQKLLQDRLKKKQQVEAEVAKVEAELQYVLDPSKLPQTGSKALAWPLDRVLITQGFGNTSFALSHTSVYNGKGHNGIDLAAATGDKLKAAASGVVMGTGDADLTCKGASYGKWILIGHDNGLATVYAHLSGIKVTEGQRVVTGQLIGYTGSTGYVTGPHLHFSVLAKEAVKVGLLKSKVPGCGIYRIPLASYSAYLNPFNYLPAI